MDFSDKIIFSIFLFSSILLSSFLIGPFPIRIYASVLMLVYLLLKHKPFKIFYIAEIKLYLLFVFVFFLVLLLNGDIATFDFQKYFLSRYLICFIAAAGIICLIRDKKDLQFVLIILLIIGIINTILNVLQYFGKASDIYLVLKNTSQVEDFIDEETLGLYVGTYGLFGNIVTNGYFSSVFSIVILHFLLVTRNFYKKRFFVVIFILSIFSSFATQQRFAFLLLSLFLLFIFYVTTPKKKLVFFILIASIFLIFFIPYSSNIDLGRLNKLSDRSRSSLYGYAIEFIFNNIWLGGIDKYGTFIKQQISIPLYPHNVFLLAFIYAGIVGGIIMIFLFFRILMKIYNFISKTLYLGGKSLTLIFGGCLFVFLCNSLTHNFSLVTGSEFIWILYCCLWKSFYFERYTFVNSLIKKQNLPGTFNENSLRNR